MNKLSYIMGKIANMKPTWLGVGITIAGMLVTFALSSGSYSNQVDNNTRSLERQEIELDEVRNDLEDHKSIDSERHEEIMRALGRIEGKIGK